MTGGRHGTRGRAPARVLTVPPPGGPRRPADPPRVAPPPPPGRGGPPRHRKQKVRLTRRGWAAIRVTAGVAMTAVIAGSWALAGHGGSGGTSAAAAPAPALRVSAPAAVAAVRADGVPTPVADAVTLAGGDVSVAVYDATSGRSWSYLDAHKVEASVSKLQLLGAELRAVGTAAPSEAVQDDLTRMIGASDNAAADEVFARVHRAGVTAFDEAVGAGDVVADDSGEFGLDTSTAGDEVAVMKAFAYPNAVLPDAARARANALLAGVEADQRWGATGGVPAGVQVLVKDGWLPVEEGGWAVNTVGHVSGLGRDYVVAIMSSGNATEQAGIDRLATVSAAVWSSAGS